jgi:hypothetical protein
MGVFEATAIASLDVREFPQGVILAVVALFRLSSIIAELLSALLAWKLESRLELAIKEIDQEN